MERIRTRIFTLALLAGAGGTALAGCASDNAPLGEVVPSTTTTQGYIDTPAGERRNDPEYRFSEFTTPDGFTLECVLYNEKYDSPASLDCNWDELNQERATAQAATTSIPG